MSTSSRESIPLPANPGRALQVIDNPGVVERLLLAVWNNELDLTQTSDKGHIGWLHVAVGSRNPESVRLVHALLAAGLDVDGKTSPHHAVAVFRNQPPEVSPLIFALTDGSLDNAEALLDAGATLPDPELLYSESADIRNHPMLALLQYRKGPIREVADLWVRLSPSKQGCQTDFFNELLTQNIVLETMGMTHLKSRLAEFRVALAEADAFKQSERLDVILPEGRRPASPRHL